MKEKKIRPIKKELRILYSPEHYKRLEKQADLLDMTTSAFVRMVSMEKVTALEMAGSGNVMIAAMREMQDSAEKMEEQRK